MDIHRACERQTEGCNSFTTSLANKNYFSHFLASMLDPSANTRSAGISCILCKLVERDAQPSAVSNVIRYARLIRRLAIISSRSRSTCQPCCGRNVLALVVLCSICVQKSTSLRYNRKCIYGRESAELLRAPKLRGACVGMNVPHAFRRLGEGC